MSSLVVGSHLEGFHSLLDREHLVALDSQQHSQALQGLEHLEHLGDQGYPDDKVVMGCQQGLGVLAVQERSVYQELLLHQPLEHALDPAAKQDHMGRQGQVGPVDQWDQACQEGRVHQVGHKDLVQHLDLEVQLDQEDQEDQVDQEGLVNHLDLGHQEGQQHQLGYLVDHGDQ